MIRATFEVDPPGWNEAFAEWRADEVGGGDGRIVLAVPEDNWGDDVSLLVSALVAGEAMEVGALRRCRLVGLELPDRLLPGPALSGSANAVGVIVKPSLGLTPLEVAEVARAAIGGGATFIKDDETLGNPPWCRFEDRVAAVAQVLERDVVYCANVTGPMESLVERARRAVSLGATGVLINPFVAGLGALIALRAANLGVPIFAHRAGSGPWARNDRFGASGAVLTRLTRLCGADYVIVGAYHGKLFETDEEVDANLLAARGACGTTRPAVAVLGGGLGPDDVRRQLERAGGSGLLVVLGTRARDFPGGLAAGLRRAVSELDSAESR